MVRFVILVLIIAIGCWGWQNFKPEAFTKESIEAKMKEEKTINTVQTTRENAVWKLKKLWISFNNKKAVNLMTAFLLPRIIIRNFPAVELD